VLDDLEAYLGRVVRPLARRDASDLGAQDLVLGVELGKLYSEALVLRKQRGLAVAPLLEPDERREAGESEALCGGEEGLGGWPREQPASGPSDDGAIFKTLGENPKK